MPKTKTLGAVALTSLLLASCAAVGPNFHAPAAPTTTGYAMAGDAAPGAGVRFGPPAAGPWWTEFGPPALDQLEQQAIAGSPSIAEADAALDQARASLSAAQGGLRPSVD
ncbi:MAG: RND transporter, partial [Pseudomonadota bacterium]|nr:RND transporter [Pseudomonadota bacterium]